MKVQKLMDKKCLKSKYGCKIPKMEKEQSQEDKDQKWYNDRAVEDAEIEASKTKYETGPDVDKEHKWYNDRAIEEAAEEADKQKGGRNPSSVKKMPEQTTQYGSKVVEPKDKSLPIIKISDKIKSLEQVADEEKFKKKYNFRKNR